MSECKTIGVVGAGTMGRGIVQLFAQAGHVVRCHDAQAGAAAKAVDYVDGMLAKLVDKGRLEHVELERIRGRMTACASLSDLADCDVVIEAIVEDLGAKRELFRALEGIVGEGAILASNTSSLTVSDIAAGCARPERVAGLHFFNPVPLMQLVEVVRTVTTSEETFKRAYAFAKSLGKEAVAAKDTSGFIVNLLLVPYLLDAIRAVERGVGSVPDVDKAMQLGCGYPMGPLTLLDFVGLDTTYHIAEIMFKEYREQRYAPPPLLKRMVLAGMYGKKSGRGFYDYAANPPVVSSLGL